MQTRGVSSDQLCGPKPFEVPQSMGRTASVQGVSSEAVVCVLSHAFPWTSKARLCPSGWAGSPGLVGTACGVFCVPSWQPAWCWSRVHSTDYQGTKPDADRSGMS